MTPAISSQGNYSYLQSIGYRPALIGNSCSLDRDLLEKRAITALIGSFSILGITTCVTIINPSTIYFTPLAVVPLIAVLFDRFVTEKIASERAVIEYMTKKTPSRDATVWTQNYLIATKQLIQKIGYYKALHIINIHVELLLSRRCSKDVFRFPIYHDPEMLFDFFIQTTDTNYIENCLSKKIITPEDFTPCRQVYLWTHIQSDSVARMLIQNGFTINIRNRDGYTPLMELARLNPRESEKTREIVTRIKLLLRFGADNTLTILVRGKTRIARDLAVDPEIRQPLTFKQRRVRFIF